MQYCIYIYLSVMFEFTVLTYMYICWCKEEEKTKSVNGSKSYNLVEIMCIYWCIKEEKTKLVND